MTSVEVWRNPEDAPTAETPVVRPDAADASTATARPPRRPASVAGLAVGWIVVTLAVVVVVLYAFGPIFPQRQQHRLLVQYRAAVKQASLEDTGLFGVTLPTTPPPTGSSVGILEIGRLRLQDVVVEGAGPSQTEDAPGHVPGTAGLGQPGNSVVVARRAQYGRPFSGLSSLRKGDSIVVTTTEGQSLYIVKQVRTLKLTAPSAAQADQATASTASTTVEAPATLGASVPLADLYGPSTDNRLTLVTSGSLVPWNTAKATVVVATMKTVPFEPTPQQSTSASEDGRSAAGGAAAPLVLALLVFGGIAVGAVILYRRCPARSAYLVSTPPLVVSAILLAEAVSHTLPAWA